MRDDLYRATIGNSSGRRSTIPSYVEQMFLNKYNQESFGPSVKQQVVAAFKGIYDSKGVFKFPLTTVDQGQLWSKLHEISSQLSYGCIIIDDVSGLQALPRMLNADSREREMVLVVTPFTVSRLTRLMENEKRGTLRNEDDASQLRAFDRFLALPKKKMLIIHSPMVAQNNNDFVTGFFLPGTMFRPYTKASDAILNANQHTLFTVPLSGEVDFPQSLPFSVMADETRDTKIIGLRSEQARERKKRVLIGLVNEAWAELTSKPTHTNAEFGDCVVILLSSLVPNSMCSVRDSGVMNNLEVFQSCISTSRVEPNAIVTLQTPMGFYTRSDGTDCARDWLITMIEMYFEHRVYYYDENTGENELDDKVLGHVNADDRGFVTTRIEVPVWVKAKSEYPLLEPFRIRHRARHRIEVVISETLSHYQCKLLHTGDDPSTFIVIASLFHNIGETETLDRMGHVELDRNGDIHDFVYQTSLLHYLTARQGSIGVNPDGSHASNNITMQVVEFTDVSGGYRLSGDNITPSVRTLRKSAIPSGFSVGKFENNDTIRGIWEDAIEKVGSSHGWTRTKSPTPGSKRKFEEEKEPLLIPPKNAGFQQITFTPVQMSLLPIQWLSGNSKPPERVLQHIVNTNGEFSKIAQVGKLKKTLYYTLLLTALKEMRYLLPVGVNKYEVYNRPPPLDPPA